MAKTKSQKARRNRMWKKDRRCRKCRVSTILPEDAAAMHCIEDLGNLIKHLPHETRYRLATIQHLVSRSNPDRMNHKANEVRYALWCWKCNNDDGRVSQFLAEALK